MIRRPFISAGGAALLAVGLKVDRAALTGQDGNDIKAIDLKPFNVNVWTHLLERENAT